MKKIKILLLPFIALILDYTSCNKNEIISMTEFTRPKICNVTQNMVTVTTEILQVGSKLEYYGHCYSTTSKPTVEDSVTISSYAQTGNFINEITGLMPNTTYFIRPYVIETEISYGPEQIFKTYATQALTDFDGNYYDTVVIGSQVWMKENLKVKHYNNGKPIPNVTDYEEWVYLVDNNTDDAYSLYNNGNDCNTYGALYTWAAAMGDNAVSSNENPSGVQGICPNGWHLPIDTEWTELTDYLINNHYGFGGDGNDIAKSLATTYGWDSISNAGCVGNDQSSNNSSQFSALPGGYRYIGYGNFPFMGTNGYWWTSTEYSAVEAWPRSIYFNFNGILRESHRKSYGFSVRCVKD